LAALKGSSVDSLVAAEVRDDLLCAVFGEVDQATADGLLGKSPCR
jgi:hypothetical protein